MWLKLYENGSAEYHLHAGNMLERFQHMIVDVLPNMIVDVMPLRHKIVDVMPLRHMIVDVMSSCLYDT